MWHQCCNVQTRVTSWRPCDDQGKELNLFHLNRFIMATKATAAVGAAAAGVAGAASFAYMSFSRPQKSSDAPLDSQKMRQMFLVQPNRDVAKIEIQVKQVDIPKPSKGQVLVKMVAAPVNPSDYAKWMQVFEDKQEDPQPMGLEGAGIVVASGGGILANRLVGKTVGVIAMNGGGTFCEYLCVDAMQGCFVIDSNIKPEDAASFFVNPFTTLSILDTAASHGSKAFIHTAAASQLGQMMVKAAATKGMTVVNLVRRQEQVDILKKLGAEYIVCTADKDWKEQLKTIINELNVTVAFDAIAGEMSGTLLSLLPPKASCFVYGGLSTENVGNLPIVDLIYHKKHLEGFLVMQWIESGGTLAMIRRMKKATRDVNAGLVEGGWAQSTFVDCTMETMFSKFLEMWNKDGFTGKKLRIRMDQ
jgi:NADPH:quinone reductase-like Zn-dependent oxidoreductase